MERDGIRWQLFRFKDMDAQLLHDLMRLRVDVFVVEQQCPYPELDGLDPAALHVVGMDPQGIPVACCRILLPHPDGLPHIGRVAVAKHRRGEGLGRQVMETAHAAVRERFGPVATALAAQAYLRRFYQDLGYAASGDEYPLDGIPHVDMIRPAAAI
jgi:ElaA protein